MLTQDDLVAPSMSAEAILRRSSWKAEAIRRGDLKISGPIPITEETPLSEDEERKYAEKHNTEPPDASSQAHQQPLPQPQPSLHHETPHPTSEQVEVEPQPPDGHHELRHKRSSTDIRVTSEMQRRSSIEPVSYSSSSPFPSVPDGSTRTTPRKKRKSGLRNAFRKMFGKRSKDESREEGDTGQRGHEHHISDPGLLRQSPERSKENTRAARISELPVRELKPINPLGQHLPFPMNVNAPQESSPPHEYLTFETPPPEIHRRRATLPSILVAKNEAQAGGLDKQLASWDERPDGESIPSPQIGIALSSPTHATHSVHSVQSKRRSRSAGALRDLARSRPSTERRRSAEIRYWRNSYQSGSIYSTNTPRPRTAQTVETVRTIDTHDTTAKGSESIAEPSTALAPTVAQHDQDLSLIQLPVEAFNFGNLKSEFLDEEDHENEPKGTARSEKRLSIEDRVKNLEDNMRTLETSVHRISGRSNRQTIILENAPKGQRSRNRSSSATSSHHSSKSSNNTLSGKQEFSTPLTPTLAPLSAVNEFPSSDDRRQTIIALEPSAMPRSTTSHKSELAEQLAAIHEALKHERGARRELEKQVMNLQREVSELHAIVNKFISQSPSYPTPSPDAVITSNEERLSTPRASTRPEHNYGHGLGLAYEGDGRAERGIRETVLSRFSQGDSDSEGGNLSLSSSREDITSPEAWATPKEESGPGGSEVFYATRSRIDLKEKGDGQDEMF